MKMKMTKFGKMSSIFEFSISKLGYAEIFMKILGKNFSAIYFETFLTNRDKNDDENEKTWENKSDFLILYIRIKLNGNFHENLWEKNFDPPHEKIN